MRSALGLAVSVLLFTSCGRGSPTAEPTAVATSEGRSGCPSGLAFRPSYLPDGIERTLSEGPGGGAARHPAAVEFHHAGPEGVFIDLRRGAAFFPVAEPTPIRVLGVTAEFGEIEDGFGVNFQTEPNSCGRYEISAYGLDRDEVRRFAEGLQSR